MEMILFVGLPGSGKSTFYQKQFSTTHLRINLDMLRTRKREAAILEACLKTGQRFVVDNTCPSVEVRASYLERALAAKFSAEAYYFDVPFDTCLERNNLRTGKAKVPEAGVKSIAKQLVRPELSEGFKRIFHVDVDGRQSRT